MSRRTSRRVADSRDPECFENNLGKFFDLLQFTSHSFGSFSPECERHVKVFNSSVENFVEKPHAEFRTARDCNGLLLIAQI